MGGLALVKSKDYEAGAEVESASPYSLWKELQTSASKSLKDERPLAPGDLLETMGELGPAQLLIAKYIGFEPAQWVIPEAKVTDPVNSPAEYVGIERADRILQS